MISIVIPMYNAQKTIGQTIESIMRSDYSESEIIVVDDGSSDRSIGIASSYPVRLIRLDRNGGPALARNVGASQAKGKYILFIDSDVVLRTDTIFKMKEAVESLDIDALVAIYEKEPMNKGFFPRFKSLHNWNYSKFRNGEIRPHTVFATFCAMIRKDVFDEIGGFDIRYKSNDVEDYELGYRLVDKGHTLYRHSGIEVGHHFPNLRKGIQIYISRCFYWTDLFLRRLKFDTGGTSGRDALGMLAGAMIPFFLIFRLTLPLLVSIMVYSICFLDLFTLFYKTAGFSFLVKGILVQILLSCVVVLSSSFAIITHPIRKR